MSNKTALAAPLLFLANACLAQFQIGHTTITFTDPARNNRPIATEIYYPANTAGDNVPVAGGAFQVVNFGHGFVMTVSSYPNIWNGLVPEGFIVCLPTTEGGFLPNHTEFAKDLAFLCTAMNAQNALPASLFFNHVEPTFAIFGHSMGGGCSILAQQYNVSQIKCIGGLAPANTMPSAITAAASIGVPSLVFAGSYDCIAPPAAHAKPIWDALLPTLCKFYVNITGGSHCQFGGPNTNCTLGEVLSGCSMPPISASQQQGLVDDILVRWLKYFLKNDNDAYLELVDILDTANGFSKLAMCNTQSPMTAAGDVFSMKILGNPVAGDAISVEISGTVPGENLRFFLTDLAGRVVFENEKTIGPDVEKKEIDVKNLPGGVYFLNIFSEKSFSRQSVKVVIL